MNKYPGQQDVKLKTIKFHVMIVIFITNTNGYGNGNSNRSLHLQ